MRTIKNLPLSKVIDYTTIWLIGMACYCYAIFGATFAELNVKFSFLSFPVFIGEILLGISIILFLTKAGLEHIPMTPWRLFFILSYVLFVLGKALYGYIKYDQWGALALRHAAEFYYPLFAVIAYYSYRESLFRKRLVYFLLIAVLVAYITTVYVYSVLPLLLVALICIRRVEKPAAQGIFLLLVLFLVPYKNLFDDGRTRIFGNAMGLIALFILLINRFVHGRKRLKFALVGVSMIILVSVIFMVADSNATKSLVSFDAIYVKWKKINDTIADKEKSFVFGAYGVRLYNKNKFSFMPGKKAALSPVEVAVETAGTVTIRGTPMQVSHAAVGQAVTSAVNGNINNISSNAESGPEVFASNMEPPIEVLPETISPENVATKPPLGRSLETANNNILFRLLIWKDIIHEIKQKKSPLGIDFGFPFRSKSLEILGWADDVWEKDGWISIHNSYLDMIYRGGVVGVALVVLVFFYAFKIIYFAVTSRSLTGLCIVSLLLFWLTVANFTEFLELPYTAIPFWSFLGLALAYRREKSLGVDNEKFLQEIERYALAK